MNSRVLLSLVIAVSAGAAVWIYCLRKSGKENTDVKVHAKPDSKIPDLPARVASGTLPDPSTWIDPWSATDTKKSLTAQHEAESAAPVVPLAFKSEGEAVQSIEESWKWLSSHAENDKEYTMQALELRKKVQWSIEKWPISKSSAQWRRWSLMAAERCGLKILWGEELWSYAQEESLSKSGGQKKPEIYALREMYRATAEKKMEAARAYAHAVIDKAPSTPEAQKAQLELGKLLMVNPAASIESQNAFAAASQSTDPKTSSQAMKGLFYQALIQGNSKEVVSSAEELLKLKSLKTNERPQVIYELARALSNLKQNDKALAVCQQYHAECKDPMYDSRMVTLEAQLNRKMADELLKP